ncbi:hypothetical protein CHUAL_014145 [Chamberlinius hualienensis]
MMSENKEHFRHIMLFYYRKGKNASKTCEKICSVYGADAVDDSTCRKWFRRFRQGNFDVKDASRAGRPIIPITIDHFKTKTIKKKTKKRQTKGPKKDQAKDHTEHDLMTREIGQALNMTATNVSRQLQKLGMVIGQESRFLGAPSNELGRRLPV